MFLKTTKVPENKKRFPRFKTVFTHIPKQLILTDRQINRQMDVDVQANGQTYRQADRQTVIRIDR